MFYALFVEHGHLVKNLVWIEVAHPFELGSGTKSTVKTTPHLAGNTSRGTGLGRNQNRFHHLVVIKAYRIFDGPIFADLHFGNIGVVDFKVLVEQSAVCLGKVGHLIEINCCFLPQPFIHLIAVKRWCVM